MSALRTNRGAGRGVAGAEVGPSRRITPFWILQVAEIFSVLALADLSLHVSRGGVLAATGGIFAALALTADGPLGLIRIFGRRLHVILVVVVALVVAISPALAAIRPDVEGIIILEVVAVGIIRLATLVNTDPRPARPEGVRGSGPVVDATATVATARSARTGPSPSSSPPSTRSFLPTEESVGAAARWAGRAAGAATSAASRSTAKHGPAAKVQVKRTIRTAGRLVGRARATSRPERPTAETG